MRRRVTACPPLRLAAFVAALVVGAWAGSASADGTDSGPESTSHLLVGMRPRTGFEVTRDDSLVSHDPVFSDDLGLIWFSIDGQPGDPSGLVRLRVPAPPVITGQHVTATADTSAVVAWQTDRPAMSRVEYGLTGAYGSTTPLTQRYVRSHTIVLTDLTPETTYHFRSYSIDAFGHSAVTGDRTLTTLPARPRVLDVAASGDSPTSLAITWRTTRPCDTRLEYGTDPLYGNWSVHDPSLTLEHAVVLDGLLPFTEYHLRAWGTDEYGRSASSGDRTAMTAPPALAILNATVADTNSVTATVVWTTTNPASSRVEYGLTTAYGQITDPFEDPATDHLVVLEGLTPDATYHFRALSVDSYGQSAASPDGEFTTHAVDYPEALVIYVPTVTALSWNGATVNWLTNIPANSTVEYGPTEAYGSAAFDASLGVRHAVRLTGLEEGTTYHFRISSETPAGTLASTTDATFRTLLRPLEITGLSVAGVDTSSFTVRWATSRPASGSIEYGPDESYGDSSPAHPGMTLDHTVVVEGLEPGTEYHFRAVSVDAEGYPAWSDDGAVTTAAPPLVVLGAAVTDTTSWSATVSWRTNSPATSRVDYGETAAYGLSTAEDPALTTQHEVVVEGLEPATEYHFRAVSEDGHGQDASSADGVFATPPSDAEPLLLSEVAVADAGPTHATVVWRTDRGASSTVEYGLTDAYGGVEGSPGLVTEHSVTITGLFANTPYHYRVRSRTAGGAQAVSEDRVLVTPPLADLMPPSSPERLAVVSRVGGVTIAWAANAEPDLAGYAVYRAAEGEAAAALIATVGPSDNAFTDGSAAPGLLYEYAVAAFDGAGNESQRSGPVSAVPLSGEAGGVWAYPNPSRGSVSIRVASGSPASRSGEPCVVTVHDAVGRAVATLNAEETPMGYGTTRWDAMDSEGRRVPNGVYFCTASFPSGTCRTKIIIVR